MLKGSYREQENWCDAQDALDYVQLVGKAEKMWRM
jgi:hypothetical protein